MTNPVTLSLLSDLNSILTASLTGSTPLPPQDVLTGDEPVEEVVTPASRSTPLPIDSEEVEVELGALSPDSEASETEVETDVEVLSQSPELSPSPDSESDASSSDSEAQEEEPDPDYEADLQEIIEELRSLSLESRAISGIEFQISNVADLFARLIDARRRLAETVTKIRADHVQAISDNVVKIDSILSSTTATKEELSRVPQYAESIRSNTEYLEALPSIEAFNRESERINESIKSRDEVMTEADGVMFQKASAVIANSLRESIKPFITFVDNQKEDASPTPVSEVVTGFFISESSRQLFNIFKEASQLSERKSLESQERRLKDNRPYLHSALTLVASEVEAVKEKLAKSQTKALALEEKLKINEAELSSKSARLEALNEEISLEKESAVLEKDKKSLTKNLSILSKDKTLAEAQVASLKREKLRIEKPIREELKKKEIEIQAEKEVIENSRRDIESRANLVTTLPGEAFTVESLAARKEEFQKGLEENARRQGGILSRGFRRVFAPAKSRELNGEKTRLTSLVVISDEALKCKADLEVVAKKDQSYRAQVEKLNSGAVFEDPDMAAQYKEVTDALVVEENKLSGLTLESESTTKELLAIDQRIATSNIAGRKGLAAMDAEKATLIVDIGVLSSVANQDREKLTSLNEKILQRQSELLDKEAILLSNQSALSVADLQLEAITKELENLGVVQEDAAPPALDEADALAAEGAEMSPSPTDAAAEPSIEDILTRATQFAEASLLDPRVARTVVTVESRAKKETALKDAVKSGLGEMFTLASAIASGKVTINKNKKGKAAEAISLAGQAISMPIISHVLAATGKGLGLIFSAMQKKDNAKIIALKDSITAKITSSPDSEFESFEGVLEAIATRIAEAYGASTDPLLDHIGAATIVALAGNIALDIIEKIANSEIKIGTADDLNQLVDGIVEKSLNTRPVSAVGKKLDKVSFLRKRKPTEKDEFGNNITPEGARKGVGIEFIVNEGTPEERLVRLLPEGIREDAKYGFFTPPATSKYVQEYLQSGAVAGYSPYVSREERFESKFNLLSQSLGIAAIPTTPVVTDPALTPPVEDLAITAKKEAIMGIAITYANALHISKRPHSDRNMQGFLKASIAEANSKLAPEQAVNAEDPAIVKQFQEVADAYNLMQNRRSKGTSNFELLSAGTALLVGHALKNQTVQDAVEQAVGQDVKTLVIDPLAVAALNEVAGQSVAVALKAKLSARASDDIAKPVNQADGLMQIRELLAMDLAQPSQFSFIKSRRLGAGAAPDLEQILQEVVSISQHHAVTMNGDRNQTKVELAKTDLFYNGTISTTKSRSLERQMYNRLVVMVENLAELHVQHLASVAAGAETDPTYQIIDTSPQKLIGSLNSLYSALGIASEPSDPAPTVTLDKQTSIKNIVELYADRIHSQGRSHTDKQMRQFLMLELQANPQTQALAADPNLVKKFQDAADIYNMTLGRQSSQDQKKLAEAVKRTALSAVSSAASLAGEALATDRGREIVDDVRGRVSGKVGEGLGTRAQSITEKAIDKGIAMATGGAEESGDVLETVLTEEEAAAEQQKAAALQRQLEANIAASVEDQTLILETLQARLKGASRVAATRPPLATQEAALDKLRAFITDELRTSVANSILTPAARAMGIEEILKETIATAQYNSEIIARNPRAAKEKLVGTQLFEKGVFKTITFGEKRDPKRNRFDELKAIVTDLSKLDVQHKLNPTSLPTYQTFDISEQKFRASIDNLAITLGINPPAPLGENPPAADAAAFDLATQQYQRKHESLRAAVEDYTIAVKGDHLQLNKFQKMFRFQVGQLTDGSPLPETTFDTIQDVFVKAVNACDVNEKITIEEDKKRFGVASASAPKVAKSTEKLEERLSDALLPSMFLNSDSKEANLKALVDLAKANAEEISGNVGGASRDDKAKAMLKASGILKEGTYFKLRRKGNSWSDDRIRFDIAVVAFANLARGFHEASLAPLVAEVNLDAGVSSEPSTGVEVIDTMPAEVRDSLNEIVLSIREKTASAGIDIATLSEEEVLALREQAAQSGLDLDSLTPEQIKDLVNPPSGDISPIGTFHVASGINMTAAPRSAGTEVGGR